MFGIANKEIDMISSTARVVSDNASDTSNISSVFKAGPERLVCGVQGKDTTATGASPSPISTRPRPGHTPASPIGSRASCNRLSGEMEGASTTMTVIGNGQAATDNNPLPDRRLTLPLEPLLLESLLPPDCTRTSSLFSQVIQL